MYKISSTIFSNFMLIIIADVEKHIHKSYWI